MQALLNLSIRAVCVAKTLLADTTSNTLTLSEVTTETFGMLRADKAAKSLPFSKTTNTLVSIDKLARIV